MTKLGYAKDDDYFLKIEGDNDGIKASECPTNALAKVTNSTPEDIAFAMLIGGVLAAFLLFGGLIFAFYSPHHQENEFFE